MRPRSLLLFGLMDPERDRATDNRGGGERAEIASVERVGGPRVHQENFVLADDAAALPDRKRAAPPVTLSGVAHFDCADSDAAADAADRLSGKCRYRFRCELSRWRDSRYMDPGWIGRGGANGSGRRLQGAAIHR